MAGMVEGLFSVRNLQKICFVKPRFYSLYPACVVRRLYFPDFGIKPISEIRLQYSFAFSPVWASSLNAMTMRYVYGV